MAQLPLIRFGNIAAFLSSGGMMTPYVQNFENLLLVQMQHRDHPLYKQCKRQHTSSIP